MLNVEIPARSSSTTADAGGQDVTPTMKQWKTKKLRQLAKALLSLKTEQEMMAFLRDVGTLEELTELSHRWDVVLQLHKGKSYRDIAQQTGMSTATVTRIAHWLHHGEDGYRTALAKQTPRKK